MSTQDNGRETATLAGGCFWCLEAVFEQLRGVECVQPGYSGGHVPNPTYQQVCTGATGHAEAVQITFTPQDVSFSELLDVFFATHDPTTLNRQGPDIGTQYRSAIFYHTPAQKVAADEAISMLAANHIYGRSIVTEVAPLEAFYPAEEYHQEYYRSNPNQPYCQVLIAPKVAKFRKEFLQRLKSKATQARS